MDFQTQIDEIMDHFNFTRVADVMHHLNWTWYSIDGIPSESEIRTEARKRLRELQGTSNTLTSSGGLAAGTDSDGYLYLRFELDSWETNPNY